MEESKGHQNGLEVDDAHTLQLYLDEISSFLAGKPLLQNLCKSKWEAAKKAAKEAAEESDEALTKMRPYKGYLYKSSNVAVASNS